MKIQYCSDLHLESNRTVELTPTGADVWVLAGDIHNGLLGLRFAEQLAARHQRPVIYVAGNHEFYRGDLEEVIADLRRGAAGLDGVYFLEQDAVELDGVRFLGTTLWTDLEGDGTSPLSHNIAVAGELLNDFRLIAYHNRLLTPQDTIRLHAESRAWLSAQLRTPFAGKTVVVTHHAPSVICRHPFFAQSDTAAGFLSDIPELIPLADAWIFGHSHANLRSTLAGCQLCSNQLGYKGESLPEPFDPAAVLIV